MDWIIRCFAGHVAALDPLRELDLLRRGQQRVAAGLPQEELERIGRRFGRCGGRAWGSRLGLAVSSSTSIPRSVEHSVDRVHLERLERVRLQRLEQLGCAHGAGQLCSLEQLLELFRLDDCVDRGDWRFHHAGTRIAGPFVD